MPRSHRQTPCSARGALPPALAVAGVWLAAAAAAALGLGACGDADLGPATLGAVAPPTPPDTDAGADVGAPCLPNCEATGAACGDDGCGGSCGSCAPGYGCTDEGACVAIDGCEADCEGKVCGANGCGGSCGTCPDGTACNDAGLCEAGCVPACAASDQACGPDGCGGSCGLCEAGTSCVGGECLPECVPDCGDKSCGDDGCGGSCGECGAGEVCDDAGQCEPIGCEPDCAGKACGDDGCGGVCGECYGCDGPDASLCWGDGAYCATPCCPDCEGKACGGDGCGGVCGVCGGGELCDGAQCLDDPCTPNPCTTPPAAFCTPDGGGVKTPTATGECALSWSSGGVEAQCTYTVGTTPCPDGTVCASGGECTPVGAPAVDPGGQGSVAIELSLPSGVGFDLDGDGGVDSAVNDLLAATGPLLGLGSLDDVLQDAVDSGQVLMFLEHVGLDLDGATASDPDGLVVNVLTVYATPDAMAPDFSGTGTFLAQPQSYQPATGLPFIRFTDATIVDALLSGTAETFPVSFALGGAVLEVTIELAQLEATVSPNPSGLGPDLASGVIGGAIPMTDVYDALNTYVAAECGCLGLGSDPLIAYSGEAGPASCAPVSGSTCGGADGFCGQLGSFCSLALGFVSADIDTNADGVADAISVGLAFEATSGDLTGVGLDLPIVGCGGGCLGGRDVTPWPALTVSALLIAWLVRRRRRAEVA